MVDADLDRARKALNRCSLGCGPSAAKRFVRDIQAVPIETLTEKQRRWIVRLCWRFRRQLPRDLVPSKDAVEAKDRGWEAYRVGDMEVYTSPRLPPGAVLIAPKAQMERPSPQLRLPIF